MLWHGSDEVFSAFSMTSAGRKGRASNGALGVWCMLDRDNARSFGENGAVYGIRDADLKRVRMTVSELRRLHDEAAHLASIEDEIRFYQEIREGLLSSGAERIDVMEKSGVSCMCILLNPDEIVIESIELMRGPSPEA